VKYSIYDACKIAESQGGQCLSNNYINCNTPLRWKCAKKHEWTANFHSIKNGKTWCSTCSDTRLDISVAKELAYSKNGECLSEEYINNRSPLLWHCDKEHEWIANLMKIKNHSSWCPGCRRIKPLNLEIAKQIAHDRNGKCLSTEYKNSNAPMQWQCVMGYKWNATLRSISGRPPKVLVDDRRRVDDRRWIEDRCQIDVTAAASLS
ncbi:23482_t:CDS:1, partial [Racocetra persica]